MCRGYRPSDRAVQAELAGLLGVVFVVLLAVGVGLAALLLGWW